MRVRLTYGLRTLLLGTDIVAGGVKWWVGPYVFDEPAPTCPVGAPDVSTYTAYRTLAGNRVRHGLAVQEWHSDGRLYKRVEEYYRHGQLDGPYIEERFSNDEPPRTSSQSDPLSLPKSVDEKSNESLTRTEGQYRAGKQVGDWVSRNSQGKQVRSEHFEDDQITLLAKWHANGHIAELTRRLPNGRFQADAWYSNGQRRYAGKFSCDDGQLSRNIIEHDQWTWWGTLAGQVDQVEFVNGVPRLKLSADELRVLEKGVEEICECGTPRAARNGVCVATLIEYWRDCGSKVEIAENLRQRIDELDREDVYPGVRAANSLILALRRQGLSFRSPRQGFVEIYSTE